MIPEQEIDYNQTLEFPVDSQVDFCDHLKLIQLVIKEGKT